MATREVRFPEDSSPLLSKQWTSGSGQNWGYPQAMQGTDPLPEQQNLLFLSSKTGQGQQTTGHRVLLPSCLSQTRVVWFLSLTFFHKGVFNAVQPGQLLSWTTRWVLSHPGRREARAEAVCSSPHNEGLQPLWQLPVGSECEEEQLRDVVAEPWSPPFFVSCLLLEIFFPTCMKKNINWTRRTCK